MHTYSQHALLFYANVVFACVILWTIKTCRTARATRTSVTMISDLTTKKDTKEELPAVKASDKVNQAFRRGAAGRGCGGRGERGRVDWSWEVAYCCSFTVSVSTPRDGTPADTTIANACLMEPRTFKTGRK